MFWKKNKSVDVCFRCKQPFNRYIIKDHLLNFQLCSACSDSFDRWLLKNKEVVVTTETMSKEVVETHKTQKKKAKAKKKGFFKRKSKAKPSSPSPVAGVENPTIDSAGDWQRSEQEE